MIDLSILEAKVKSLNASLGTAGVLLAVSTAAVVIGLVIEYTGDFVEFVAAVRLATARRSMWPLRILDKKTKRAVCGGILVVLGVGFELRYEWKTSTLEGDLEGTNDQIVQRLGDDAEQLEARLKVAMDGTKSLGDQVSALSGIARREDTDLEHARQNIALLQKETDRERAAIIAGEKAARWRSTNLMFCPEFIAGLKSKPPATVEVLYTPGDDEAKEFAFSVWTEIVLGARWNPISDPREITPDMMSPLLRTAPPRVAQRVTPTMRLGGQPGGVSIIAKEPPKPQKVPFPIDVSTPGGALTNAFLVCGFSVGGGVDTELPVDARVLIGTKN